VFFTFDLVTRKDWFVLVDIMVALYVWKPRKV